MFFCCLNDIIVLACCYVVGPFPSDGESSAVPSDWFYRGVFKHCPAVVKVRYRTLLAVWWGPWGALTGLELFGGPSVQTEWEKRGFMTINRFTDESFYLEHQHVALKE